MTIGPVDDNSTLLLVIAAIKAIIWMNLDPDLCHNMISPGHNELNERCIIDPAKMCINISDQHIH